MQENPINDLGLGYLVIKASTARGAIPLENASVYIRGAEAQNSAVIHSLTTNSSGLTEKVPLPAPLRVFSEAPSTILPYAIYDVDVFKEGYTPIKLKNVAVFDSVISIQPAIMIPLADNKYKDNYARGNDTSPGDKNT